MALADRRGVVYRIATAIANEYNAAVDIVNRLSEEIKMAPQRRVTLRTIAVVGDLTPSNHRTNDASTTAAAVAGAGDAH